MEKLTPEDPQSIGAYRLLARLGSGGLGQVFLARSERGATVALRVVRRGLAEQEAFRAAFRQEVAAARRVTGSWTAPVFDADTEAEVPWVVTGYVTGPTLQSVVSGTGPGHGPLPERTVRILAGGLAHALQDIHAAGLVHRDLKPSNILITEQGPRVVDFGLARALEAATDDGLRLTGAMVGAPGFMSPEQVRGERATAAADIFSLGSVLMYAATGRLPFGATDSSAHALLLRTTHEEPDTSGLNEALAALVRDCLRKDPGERPTTQAVLSRVGGAAMSAGPEPWLPTALLAESAGNTVRLGGRPPSGGTGTAAGDGPGDGPATRQLRPIKDTDTAGGATSGGVGREHAGSPQGELARRGQPDRALPVPVREAAAAEPTTVLPVVRVPLAQPPVTSAPTTVLPVVRPSANQLPANQPPVAPPSGSPQGGGRDRLGQGAAAQRTTQRQNTPPEAPHQQHPQASTSVQQPGHQQNGYQQAVHPPTYPVGPQQPAYPAADHTGASYQGDVYQGGAYPADPYQGVQQQSGYGYPYHAPQQPGYGYPYPVQPVGAQQAGAQQLGPQQVGYGNAPQQVAAPEVVQPGGGYVYPQAPVGAYRGGEGGGAVPPTPFTGAQGEHHGQEDGEERPRGRRGTYALVAGAVIVALGVAGGVYAFSGGDGKKDVGARAAGVTPAKGATPAAGSDASRASSEPEPSSSPAAGDVPEKFVGTWEGGVHTAAGTGPRKLVIKQGRAGDTVLVLTADGPAGAKGGYHCEFTAALAAAPGKDASVLRIGPSTVSVGRPMSSCTPGHATQLTIRSDGSLRRVTTDGEALTYRKG